MELRFLQIDFLSVLSQYKGIFKGGCHKVCSENWGSIFCKIELPISGEIQFFTELVQSEIEEEFLLNGNLQVKTDENISDQKIFDENGWCFFRAYDGENYWYAGMKKSTAVYEDGVFTIDFEPKRMPVQNCFLRAERLFNAQLPREV